MGAAFVLPFHPVSAITDPVFEALPAAELASIEEYRRPGYFHAAVIAENGLLISGHWHLPERWDVSEKSPCYATFRMSAEKVRTDYSGVPSASREILRDR
jgi:hypothetical protein